MCEKFIKVCNSFEITNNRSNRSKLVMKALSESVAENILFLICGMEYLKSPSDRQLTGIRDIFIRTNGALYINIPHRTRELIMTNLSHNCHKDNPGNVQQMKNSLDLAVDQMQLSSLRITMSTSGFGCIDPLTSSVYDEAEEALSIHWDNLKHLGLKKR